MQTEREAAGKTLSPKTNAIAADLQSRISTRSAKIGVIGLGYVGLPLAMAVVRAGFPVLGLDIDPDKILELGQGNSYIDAVSNGQLSASINSERFTASADMTNAADCDILIICVPTPLSVHREPDLGFVTATLRSLLQTLRPGQLIILESTTYPGTCDEVMKPILEQSGLRCGEDFFIGFSPEREDPGNARFHTASIPKVVSGDGPLAAGLVQQFYDAVVEQTVQVSSTRVAEAVKITENIFRSVNVALVNELKMIFEKMDIDIWEVIDAAATKPFGYMPFYPGPGLGGHCIPIDPFYLSWRAREFGMPTRFIELAGEINVGMPHYVIERLGEALDAAFGKSLGQSRILIVGIAYKKNVADMRESPSLHLMEMLDRRGTKVEYHDPHVPAIPPTREHLRLAGRKSVPLTSDAVAEYDAVLIATDHDAIDYALLGQNATLIVDTRNAMERRGLALDKVCKA